MRADIQSRESGFLRSYQQIRLAAIAAGLGQAGVIGAGGGRRVRAGNVVAVVLPRRGCRVAQDLAVARGGIAAERVPVDTSVVVVYTESLPVTSLALSLSLAD